MTETLTHYINGEKVTADTPHESLNPSDTREVVARFPDGGAAEVDAAVDIALEMTRLARKTAELVLARVPGRHQRRKKQRERRIRIVIERGQ